jgi:predicted Zn-dependent peptidase
LGDGMSSRLNQLLREKLGYVYTVYSTISLIKECGTMSIYAASENNKIDKIRDIILKEIEKIFISNLTKKEIDRAKEQIKSNSIMALEGMSARIQSLIKSEISFGRYESIEDTIKEIDSVSGVDVYNCAKKYLVPDEWSEVRLIAK